MTSQHQPPDTQSPFWRWLLCDGWSRIEDPIARRWQTAWVLVLWSVLLFIAWSSLNFFTYHRHYVDSGVFAAVSRHLLAGHVLYADVWDHKPPMIYLINMLPFVLGDGSISDLRLVERVFSMVAHSAFFFTLLLWFKRPFLAFCAVLVFNLHFFDPYLFQGGNMTEEYGVCFYLLALFFLVVTTQREGYLGWMSAYAVGFFFSCAVWTKEPFVFSSVIWLVMLVVMSQRGSLSKLVRSGLWMAGVLTPALFFWVAMIVTGCLDDWFDVLSYNAAYTHYSRMMNPGSIGLMARLSQAYGYLLNQTNTFFVLMMLGVLSSVYRPFVKRYSYLPWIVLIAFCLDFAACIIGGYDLAHYYLQLIPSFVLLSALGIVFVLELEVMSRWRHANIAIYGTVLLALLSVDNPAMKKYQMRMQTPPGTVRISPISKAISNLHYDEPTLWAGFGKYAKFYAETGLCSPSKYLYIYDHLFIDSAGNCAVDKMNRVEEDLKNSPPTYMIASTVDLRKMRSMGFESLVDWIEDHYRFVGVREGDTYLLVYTIASEPEQ